jgi:hypothetical protein
MRQSIRLYPFGIGTLLGGAWIADRLFNFSRCLALNRYPEKFRENQPCYNRCQLWLSENG